MRSAPSEDMLAPIFIDREDSRDQTLLQKISKAWECPIYLGKDEIARKTSGVTFYQWLRQKIQGVGPLPQNALPAKEEVPEPNVLCSETSKEALTVSPELEEEKKGLQDKLERVMLEKRKLEVENEQKREALEECQKRLKREEESKQEMKAYMQKAKAELRKSNAKLGEAMGKADEWKTLFKESVAREKIAKRSLVEARKESKAVAMELEDQLRNVRLDMESIERVLGEYKQVLRQEQEDSDELRRNLRHISEAYRQVREESQYWERRFLELIGKIEEQEIVVELRAEAGYWRSKFSNLAWLANQAVKDIPRRISRAEAEMLPTNTPVQVYKFVEFCKALTEELMEKARGAAAASTEKRKEQKLKAICL